MAHITSCSRCGGPALDGRCKDLDCEANHLSFLLRRIQDHLKKNPWQPLPKDLEIDIIAGQFRSPEDVADARRRVSEEELQNCSQEFLHTLTSVEKVHLPGDGELRFGPHRRLNPFFPGQ